MHCDVVAGRTEWPPASRERAVERFYSRGVQGQTDIHEGFLNFGLWEDGIDDYVAAAKHLVHRLGTMLGLRPGAHLLDVACGMASQDVYLRRAFGDLRIDALDVTWQHVVRATQRARDEDMADGLRVHHGSATRLPFAAEGFTHVLSIEGAEHFETRLAFLREAHRVLRPGGVMCLADYTIGRAPRSPVERVVFAATCRAWHVPRANLWTSPEYRRQLAAVGFDEISVDDVSALTFPGYHREQCRPAFRREMARLQGSLVARAGHLINVVMNRAYERGLIRYVLVRAVKPAEAGAGAGPVSVESTRAAARRSPVSKPSVNHP